MLRETLDTTSRFAWQSVRRLPDIFLYSVLRRESGPYSQDVLDRYVGKVALVGDFGYEDDAKVRSAAARRAAKVLVDNSVVETGSSVDIRAISPHTATDGDDPWLNKSMAALAKSLNARKGIAARVEPEPVMVQVDGHPSGTHIYASIRRALAQEQAEGTGDTLIMVANPFFVAQALPNITYQDMKEGGVVVFDDTSAYPQADKFLQLRAK